MLLFYTLNIGHKQPRQHLQKGVVVLHHELKSLFKFTGFKGLLGSGSRQSRFDAEILNLLLLLKLLLFELKLAFCIEILDSWSGT